MIKGISVVLMIYVFVVALSRIVFAEGIVCQGNKEETTQMATKETVEVGNKICPVSGDKIQENDKATYEYKGKIYNFCCAMCIDEFKKDQEKYIKKVEEELRAQSQEKTEKRQADR
ncbi:MAG: YHS domain-containing protein [Candidatus Omnitrophica bacterium]|nr:YHS domain-containing protein [Candidatus Omnitrophota bacterium]